jgi:hypothetical protein
MMRVCPKCGDYSGDALLAFCLKDGTPLLPVDQTSERWSEGTRVIEEKENGLRKKRRRLKWRRALLSAMTMLMAIMVVCVVAVNSFIYLRPKPEEVALADPLTPLSPPGVPALTPQPTVTTRPVPSPIAVEITSPTPTPTLTPVPTPRLTQSPTIASCSDADKSREREAITKKFGELWKQEIKSRKPQLSPSSLPFGIVNAEPSLGVLKYESTFSKECTEGFITARYVWQANVNGVIKAVTVAREKRFHCVKRNGTWLCS